MVILANTLRWPAPLLLQRNIQSNIIIEPLVKNICGAKAEIDCMMKGNIIVSNKAINANPVNTKCNKPTTQRNAERTV
eukprot:scaffold212584_cov41-Prasinocladus_malaysianus.AAC.1